MSAIQCTVIMAVGCVCVIVAYLMSRMLPLDENAGIAAVLATFITAFIMLVFCVIIRALL